MLPAQQKKKLEISAHTITNFKQNHNWFFLFVDIVVSARWYDHEQYLHNHAYHHNNIPKTNKNPEVSEVKEEFFELFSWMK